MSMSHAPQTDTSTRVGQEGGHHAGHPGPRQYVAIAIILALITAVEVVIYYVDALRPVLPPILIVLSLTKFAMVAMFFMHLKFDSRFFSVVFVTGLLLAVAVFLVFLSMLRIFFV